VARHWHGYGFLPGYRTPEGIEWEEARNRPASLLYGAPALSGRWNGGGFGPCWTQTPIAMCGMRSIVVVHPIPNGLS